MKSDKYILFGGDVVPNLRYEKSIEQGKDPLFELRDLIKNSSLSFANLECPLTNDFSQKINKSGPHLHASESLVKVLEGISLVGLANNHIYDYGKNGIRNTLKTLMNNGIEHLGAGMSREEAQKPFFKDIGNVTIGLIAVAEREFNIDENEECGAAILETEQIYYQVKEVKSACDILIVTIHGGIEYFNLPRPNFRKLARFLVNIGADAVICHHPHVSGAYEVYKDKLIAYSLGNLMFDHVNAPDGWTNGQLIKLDICEEAKKISDFSFLPIKQDLEESKVMLLQDKEKQTELEKLHDLSEILMDENVYYQNWKKFVEEKWLTSLVSSYFPISFPGIVKLSKIFGIHKLFLNRGNRHLRLNLARNPSHHELLLSSMEFFHKKENEK